MHFLTSDDLIRYVAAESDTVLLSFSCGKDSIGAWLALRPHIRRIIPVYLYLVPDLAFVEESLRSYEQVFETRIIRMPHPSLYRWLTSLTFQAPEHCRILEDLDLPTFAYDDVFSIVKQAEGVSADTLTAVGVRAADSLNRYTAVKNYGSLNERRRSFYPIFDWNKDRLYREIAASGVHLPIDYEWFGRSFDGIDYRFLEPIRRHAPADYERILTWFPLADLELAKMAYRSAYYAEIESAETHRTIA